MSRRTKLFPFVLSLVLMVASACSNAQEPVSRCDALKAGGSKPTDLSGTVMWGGDASGTWNFDVAPIRITPTKRITDFGNGVLATQDKTFIASGWRICLIDGRGRRVWSQRREGGFTVPALANDLLLGANSSAHDTHLFAFDARTGAERWSWTQPRSKEAGSGAIGVPIIDGDSVYVSGSEGLFSIDAKTGQTRWRNAEAASAAIVVRGSTVYAAAQGTLRLMDVKSGVERTQVEVGDGSVLAGAGVIYAENRTGVGAFDADSGEPRWQSQVQVVGDAPAMTLAGNILAVVGFVRSAGPDLNHRAIFGLDAATGKEHWRYTAGGEGISSSLSVAQGVLYAGNHEGFLCALDVATGRELWKTRVEIETHLDPDAPDQSGPKTKILQGDVAVIMPGDGVIYTLGRSWRISSRTSDGALFSYR